MKLPLFLFFVLGCFSHGEAAGFVRGEPRNLGDGSLFQAENAAVALGGKKNGKSGEKGKKDGDDDPMAVLESAECDELMGRIDEAVEHLLSFGDEEVTVYACSAIEREHILEMIPVISADAQTQEDPCVAALESFLANGKDHTIEALFTHDSCVAEMTNELEVLHEQRRSLHELGPRKLWLAIAALGVVFVTWMIADSIW